MIHTAHSLLTDGRESLEVQVLALAAGGRGGRARAHVAPRLPAGRRRARGRRAPAFKGGGLVRARGHAARRPRGSRGGCGGGRPPHGRPGRSVAGRGGWEGPAARRRQPRAAPSVRAPRPQQPARRGCAPRCGRQRSGRPARPAAHSVSRERSESAACCISSEVVGMGRLSGVGLLQKAGPANLSAGRCSRLCGGEGERRGASCLRAPPRPAGLGEEEAEAAGPALPARGRLPAEDASLSEAEPLRRPAPARRFSFLAGLPPVRLAPERSPAPRFRPCCGCWRGARLRGRAGFGGGQGEPARRGGGWRPRLRSPARARHPAARRRAPA